MKNLFLKRSAWIIVILLAVSLGAWAVDHHRWPIKTVPHRKTNATPVPLSALINLADPPGVTMNDKRYETKLIPPFGNSLDLKEGDLVRTEGYLHLVAFEENDDEFHIQISGSKTSGNNCLIVEVPDPKNVDDETLKERYAKVRAFIRNKILNGQEPGTGGNVIGGRAYVYVVGQLFYDASHTHNQVRGKKGMRSNSLWEIHPIVAMDFAKKPN
jgi:hypothetical protein